MSLPNNKLISVKNAMEFVKSGQSIMVGGFGLSGHPLTLIDGLLGTEIKDLTVISNNLGEIGKGLGKWVRHQRIRKAIGSYFTTNKEAVAAWEDNQLEIELVPQGTFIERIRAGGSGIGGFYVKTSVGTDLAKSKEERIIKEERYVFEYPIRADVAFIRASKADQLGNLTYYKTARNFNPAMATASDLVIAEVDEVVDVGELDPEKIVTPHLYVDYIVISEPSKLAFS
jgi:3-oxoacid CoA-transferase subunit A